MIQQNPSGFFNTNMSSNLTSASGEASASSTNPNNPSRKRRNQPGNPDPDAEVIALSPKSLLATNRFFCEICNKGFQRDQNLQLHRRGHNLPWKLKQRSSKEVVRKKVYVCPEASCVHHDPSRALGDLTGIKKHFCRKHGEKKWKCERCSKKYAVQSDWKAHSKTCGTREYRCDCGTLFSRRDSFITHRAFCDALAQESARTITTGHHPLLFSQPPAAPHANIAPQATCSFQTQFPYTGVGPTTAHEIGLKRERQDEYCSLNLRPQELINIPPPPQQPPPPPQMSSLNNYLEHLSSSSLFSSRIEHHEMAPPQAPTSSALQITTPSSFQASASPHMSATALLQRAAQMGATMSRPDDQAMEGGGARHHATTSFGLGLPFSHPKSAANGSSFQLHGPPPQAAPPPPLLHDVMMNSLTSGFAFGDPFGAILGTANRSVPDNEGFERAERRKLEEAGGVGPGTDGLTIDFLGSKAYYHGEFLNLAGMDPRMTSSSYEQQHEHTKKPWIG